MDEIRRDGDGERCGFVDEQGGRWVALAVFGGLLGEHHDRAAAEQQVRTEGLASLTERWTLHHGAAGEDEVVCLQEVTPDHVTVARSYYSMPGVPTRTITAEELSAGEWVLRRR